MDKAIESPLHADPEYLRSEQARLLYMQAPVSNATVFVIAALFYFFLSALVESDLVIAWVFALYVSALLRLLLWYLRKLRPHWLSADAWLHSYLAGSILVGLSWSLIIPLIYLAGDLVVTVGLLMLIFGIAGSAVVILSVYFPAFVVYVYPQILTLMGTLLAFDEPTHNLLALGVLGFLVMTTLFTRNVNRNLLRGIALQSHNQLLIERLNQEAGQRERLVQQRTRELRDKNQELIREIDDRKQVEEALRESEERFHLAMRGANDGVYDWNLTNNEIFFSPRWKSMLGYADDELPNQFSSWEERVDPVDRERALDMLTDYINGRRDNFNLEFRMRHKDGHWVDILSRAFLVRDEDGKAARVVGTHVDISEKKRQEQRILHQAHFDDLTDLPNRFLALDRLNQLLKEADRSDQKVAVLFLDLDGFKRVNDSLGHETGDRLLVQAARRLSTAVRECDSVCRLGGDEFIVILSGLGHASDARPVATSLISRFRDSFTLDERELVITASMGIAVFPEDGITPAELLRNADTAMYHSKEQGRNTYNYFTSAMNEDVSRRLAVEEQLHGALNRGEFSVVFHPLVGLDSERIIGAEALLRWDNPSLKQVSPDEFIPIAEQTGSIVEIGRYVLIQALEWAATWRRNHQENFKIAVNLSPRQFRDTQLWQSIEQALQQHGLPAQALELEITEGVLMSGHDYIRQSLAELHTLGVSIAMDDFGTGYSSLSYLRNYPFSVLKIDRSFIRDITIDPADRELVNAAIVMAHSLGLKVVAEGVETEEQLVHLRNKGCEIAQGYLFSHPVGGDQFTRLLQNQLVT